MGTRMASRESRMTALSTMRTATEAPSVRKMFCTRKQHGVRRPGLQLLGLNVRSADDVARHGDALMYDIPVLPSEPCAHLRVRWVAVALREVISNLLPDAGRSAAVCVCANAAGHVLRAPGKPVQTSSSTAIMTKTC